MTTAPPTTISSAGETKAQRAVWLWFSLLLACYVGLLVHTAWLCDDAYITFRTIDNFVHGYGLTWNAGERVQTYTHPLWLFLLTPFYFATGEIYFTSLAVSAILSLATVFVLFIAVARRNVTILPTMAAFIGSKALIEYSTSGLEGPLTHLLLAGFAALWMRGVADLRRLYWLSLLAALICLNRLDLVLVVAPPLGVTLWRMRGWRALGVVALGFIPVAAWELFSIFYYGFPFPNTAYAKLGAATAAGLRLRHGLAYFRNSLLWDPSTLLVIAGAAALVLASRSHRRFLPLVAGCALYMIYLLRIGGDFMSGRMFVPLLIVALAILAAPESLRISPFIRTLFAATAISSIANWYHPLNTPVGFTPATFERIDKNRIADERSWYYEWTGLLRRRRGVPWPSHALANQARTERAKDDKPFVVLNKTIGFYGFFAGPRGYIVDLYALSDPLLARMPPVPGRPFRPGHIERQVPPGYFDTFKERRNRITDPQISRFYQRLLIVIRGPLLAPGRLTEIFKLNVTIRTPFEEKESDAP